MQPMRCVGGGAETFERRSESAVARYADASVVPTNYRCARTHPPYQMPLSQPPLTPVGGAHERLIEPSLLGVIENVSALVASLAVTV